MHGWDEAMARAKEFKRIGVDAIFIEALPDRDAMKRCAEEIEIPVFANIIEGGKTENISAKDLAEMGYSAVAYPWTLVAAHLKSIREALDGLKRSMTVGAPPIILTYDEVCEGVGFNKYWVSALFHSTYKNLSEYQLISVSAETRGEIQVLSFRVGGRQIARAMRREMVVPLGLFASLAHSTMPNPRLFEHGVPV